MLLKKKLSQIGNVSQPWKLRGEEKLMEVLSKIINMMKGLYQLAEQHNIKSRLYSGDRLERIHQMIGHNLVTRWLSTICEVEYNDEQTWHHLIEILERDLKVQQQKPLFKTSQKTNHRSKHMKKKSMLEDITVISLVIQV